MLGKSNSPVSFNGSYNNPNKSGSLPTGAAFPQQNDLCSGVLSALRGNVFRSSSTVETSTTYNSAGYGGTVDAGAYGGVVEPTPYVKVHYNQGIGNGAEGGDPGNSHPHGSSNDEFGRTPGKQSLFY